MSVMSEARSNQRPLHREVEGADVTPHPIGLVVAVDLQQHRPLPLALCGPERLRCFPLFRRAERVTAGNQVGLAPDRSLLKVWPTSNLVA